MVVVGSCVASIDSPMFALSALMAGRMPALPAYGSCVLLYVELTLFYRNKMRNDEVRKRGVGGGNYGVTGRMIDEDRSK